ncbi:MAG TPA: hypothetical protein VM370_08895 [Candidatus Thermoplasmatota archaeon]|nr:hypothetical protein [Candidatus Thermoplasmatota archaeon]
MPVNVKVIAASAIAILALLLGWAAVMAIKEWITTNPTYALATLVVVGGVVVTVAGPRRGGRFTPLIGAGMIIADVVLFYFA